MTKKSEFPVTAVRWHSIFVVLIALALMFFACSGDNNGGGDSSSSVAVLSSSSDCPAGIQLCVGTGSATARLFVQWNDDIEDEDDNLRPDPMAWIYRFNPADTSQNKGIHMIFAVAKADSRFSALVYYDPTIDNSTGGTGKPLGWAVGGLGYAFNDSTYVSTLTLWDSTMTTILETGLEPNSNGLFIADSGRAFDFYKNDFPDTDHWESGWVTAGFWSYQINIDTVAGYILDTLDASKFDWSMVGASTRVLKDKSADYYEWSPPWVPPTPSSSSNGGDPSSSSNGEDLSSSSSEETSASAKINPNLIHPANRNIRIK